MTLLSLLETLNPNAQIKVISQFYDQEVISGSVIDLYRSRWKNKIGGRHVIELHADGPESYTATIHYFML